MGGDVRINDVAYCEIKPNVVTGFVELYFRTGQRYIAVSVDPKGYASHLGRLFSSRLVEQLGIPRGDLAAAFVDISAALSELA